MAAWAFQGVLNVGVQILLLVFTGWCFPCFGLLSADEFMSQINVLILRVGFPSLTITLLGMKVDLRDGEVWRSLAAHAIWVVLVQGVIILYTWLRPRQGPRDAALLNLVLTANNTIIVGLPVMEATFPSQGSRLSLLSALPLFLQCIPFSITAFEMERAALADKEHYAAIVATAAAIREPPSTPQRKLSGRWGDNGGGGAGGGVGIRHIAASDEGGGGGSDGGASGACESVGGVAGRKGGGEEKNTSVRRSRVVGQSLGKGSVASSKRKERRSRRNRVESDAADRGTGAADGSAPETPRGSDTTVISRASSECTAAAAAVANGPSGARSLTHVSVGPVAPSQPTPGSVSNPRLERQASANCPSDDGAIALPPPPLTPPYIDLAKAHATTQGSKTTTAPAPAPASCDTSSLTPALGPPTGSTISCRSRSGRTLSPVTKITVTRRRGDDVTATAVRQSLKGSQSQGRGPKSQVRRSNPGAIIVGTQQPQQPTRNAAIQRYSMPVHWPPIMFMLDAASSSWPAAAAAAASVGDVSVNGRVSPIAAAHPDRTVSRAVHLAAAHGLDRPNGSVKSASVAVVRASLGAVYDSVPRVNGAGTLPSPSSHHVACAPADEAPPSASVAAAAAVDRECEIGRAATGDMIRHRRGVGAAGWYWVLDGTHQLLHSRGWLIAWIVMKNPMLWSLLVALVINLSGLRLVLVPGATHYRPELGWVYGTLNWASGITVPASLFSNGVWLYGKKFGAATMKRASFILSLKLLVLCPLQLALAGACGLRAEAAMSLLLLVLCPVASASFVIASQYGHGGDIITAVTVLGIVLLVPAALVALAVPRATGLYSYEVHRIA